jgi:hypothetical protein
LNGDRAPQLKAVVGRFHLAMTQRKPYRHSFFLACLLLLPFNALIGVFAQDASPFDRYGRINWEEEKKHLDGFANELKKQPEKIGYIYIREGQISCEGYAQGHAIDVTKYLIQTHQLPWNRVAWRDLGYGDGYEVSLWLFPAGHPPRYVPAYQSEAVYVRSRWYAKQRSLRRAANKLAADSPLAGFFPKLPGRAAEARRSVASLIKGV